MRINDESREILGEMASTIFYTRQGFPLPKGHIESLIVRMQNLPDEIKTDDGLNYSLYVGLLNDASDNSSSYI